MGIDYSELRTELVRAFPEFARPLAAIEAEEAEYPDDEPDGPYIVYGDTVHVLVEVALALDQRVGGRDALLKRAMAFAERLMQEGGEVEGVAIDSIAEWIAMRPGGQDAIDRFGGPLLRDWRDRFAADWGSHRNDEIIDIYRVRTELFPLLDVPTVADVPGISTPRPLAGLSEARASPDGAVMFERYSSPFAVVRASLVHADEEELTRLASEAFRRLGPMIDPGHPRVSYVAIPENERVWMMQRGRKRHSRLGACDVWVTRRLLLHRRWFRARIAGASR